MNFANGGVNWGVSRGGTPMSDGDGKTVDLKYADGDDQWSWMSKRAWASGVYYIARPIH